MMDCDCLLFETAPEGYVLVRPLYIMSDPATGPIWDQYVIADLNPSFLNLLNHVRYRVLFADMRQKMPAEPTYKDKSALRNRSLADVFDRYNELGQTLARLFESLNENETSGGQAVWFSEHIFGEIDTIGYEAKIGCRRLQDDLILLRLEIETGEPDIMRAVNQEIILNGTQDAMFLVRVNAAREYRYVWINQAYEKKLGISRRDLPGRTPLDLLGPELGNQVSLWYDRCVQGGQAIEYEEELNMPNGRRIWATTLTPIVRNGQPAYIVGSRTDITEQRLAERELLRNLDRSEKQLALLKSNLPRISDYLNQALELALSFTASQVGYIALYDEATETLTMHAWSVSALKDCQVRDKQIIFDMNKTGAWTEAIRRQQPVIVNDFQKPNPIKKGQPAGHVAIFNFLSVPVFDQSKIVAVIGMANKPGDYDVNDILSINLLMSSVWTAVARKRSDELLFHEKERFRTALLSIGDGILATDRNGLVTVINEVARTMTGWPGESAIGRPFAEVFRIIDEKTRQPCEDPVQQVMMSMRTVSMNNHTLLVSCDGLERPIADNAAPIINHDGSLNGVVLAFRDVSEEKQKLDRIEYLSFHDALTGLFNRRFFAEELKRCDTRRNLPLSILMGDLNGLKLVNDAFGHDFGDRLLCKAADVIKSCCRDDDIIARIGGDEFVIMLPKTQAGEVDRIVQRISILCQDTRVGSVPLSISFGWETKTSSAQNIDDIRKKAEDWMYRRKLFESPGIRNRAIEAITQTLYETHASEEMHSQRVSHLCGLIGQAMDLSEQEIHELITAGLLHDIGKIAIDGHILNKPGLLSDEEWREMRRHPEIGYRILSAANDLSDIADIVLAHHERWDGRGYPKGLSGSQIPMLSRIITVADAYDGMTGLRAFRNPLSLDAATDQIRRNAGTQFDPDIARTFLNLILKQNIS